MDVSIILVNYNTKALTQECIDSIITHTKHVSYEIILVDNASNDGSREYFSNNDKIKYIYSPKNLGFGKANNLGYTYASGKYIFLLNTDTLLLNNAVKIFFDFMENKNEKYGCAGSMLLDKRNMVMHSYGSFPTPFLLFKKYLNNYTRIFGWNIVNKHLNNIPPYYPYQVDYVTGADIFIRKSVIEKCGLFNPSFFMYYEESDMQKRYLSNGYSSWIIDSPKIMHLCGGSQKKSLKSWGLELIGGFTYSKLNFSPFEYFIIRGCAIILFLPKIILYSTSWKEKRNAISNLFKRICPQKLNILSNQWNYSG